jgi:hypothetical protein
MESKYYPNVPTLSCSTPYNVDTIKRSKPKTCDALILVKGMVKSVQVHDESITQFDSNYP